MKIAADFARFAASLSAAAQEIKPEESDRFAQARKLIQYHLQTAAAKAADIANTLAITEPPGK